MSGPGETTDRFSSSRACVEEVIGWLEGSDARALAHAEVEEQLDARGRKLLRRRLHDHLSLRAHHEIRLESVVDSDGVAHKAVEAGHHRPLASIFGPVDVERLAYRHPDRTCTGWRTRACTWVTSCTPPPFVGCASAPRCWAHELVI